MQNVKKISNLKNSKQLGKGGGSQKRTCHNELHTLCGQL